MKKRRSITHKITCLLLTFSLLSFLLTGVIGAAGLYAMKHISGDNGRELGRSAANSAEQALEKAACRQLLTVAMEKAAYIEERFQETAAYVHGIAAQAEAIYAEPEKYPDRQVPLPVKGSTELAAQLIRSEKLENPSEQQLQEILKLGNLQDLLVQYNANNDMVSSVHLATKSGWVIVADYIAGNKYAEGSDTPLTIEAEERQWFQRAAQAGQGQIVYTDVMEDIHNGGQCIIAVQPVFHDGELVAVAGVGSYLETVNEAVLSTIIGETGYAFLVNRDGRVMVSCKEDGETAADAERNPDLRAGENEALARAVTDVLFGESGLERLTLDGKEVYLAYAPLTELGWGFFTVMEVEEVIASARDGEEQILKLSETAALRQDRTIRTMMTVFAAILAVFALTVSGAGMLFGRRIAEPVRRLTRDVKKIDGGKLDYCIRVDTGDEIEELGNAFNSMTAQIKSYVDNLALATAEKERIRTELQFASRLQADMLPEYKTAFPDRKEFTLAASMTPAKSVGGDFYDFFLSDREHLVLVVADVSGKGVPAALFMVIARTMIRSHITAAKTLAGAVEKINDLLCDNNKNGMFVTAWFGVLNLTDGALTYVNAGHCRPLIRRGDGSWEYLTEQGGFVLGGMEGVKYEQTSIHLAPGELLFQYTDGVTEANDEEGALYGEARLKQCLSDGSAAVPEDVLTHVWEQVCGFQGKAEQFDDITMLAVCYNGGPCICYRGKADIEALPGVTASVEDILARYAFSTADTYKVLVAVDEIYSNICYYSKATETTIFCEADEKEIKIIFTDDGVPYNPLEKPDPDVSAQARERLVGGLGIYMVKKTMDQVSYEYEYVQERNCLTIVKEK